MSANNNKIQIKERNIIKGEVSEKDFRYIQEALQSLITQSMIDDKKVGPIRNALNEGLNTQFKEEFITIVAVEPLYYIQYRYNNLLILSFDKLSIFFYKPRQLDIPRILKLENYDEELDSKIQKFIQCITVSNQRSLVEEDNEWIGKMVEHITKFFYKYKSKYVNDLNEFETDFITKIRNYIVVIQKQMYWQIVMSKKCDFIVTQKDDEKMIEFTLNFKTMIPQFKDGQKIVMFQRKGEDPTVSQNIMSRKKELFGFIGLLVLFICVVMCRGYDDGSNLDSNSPFEIKGKKQHESHVVRDFVCPNRQTLLMGIAVMFLSMFFSRFFARFQRKQKEKEKNQEREENKKKKQASKKKKNQ